MQKFENLKETKIGSEEIFENDVENCINENPYLEGYVFEENGVLLGYAMVAKSFSTEFGKPCMWIEDIYLKPECTYAHRQPIDASRERISRANRQIRGLPLLFRLLEGNEEV